MTRAFCPPSGTIGATIEPAGSVRHGAAYAFYRRGDGTLRIAYASHNAGVVGSSPTPAIAQPVVPSWDGGLSCLGRNEVRDHGCDLEPNGAH